ncbi:MAG: selenite/tellurite reduction operon porin ExtI [Nitrospirota bacterium]
MRKIRVIAICVLCGLASLFYVPSIHAGPRIDFGEEGGYIQMDIKTQVYVENTDIGSGPTGDSNRTDIHFQRNRLSLTGMLDEVWGMKFQTCGNASTTKTPAGYTFSQVNDSNDRDVRIIDAYVIGNFSEAVNMKLGLTKIPLTRANLDDCFAPLSLDRSMFVYTPFGGSAIKFTRDTGLVLWGSFGDEKLKYWAGALEGREGVFKWTVPGQTVLPLPSTSTSSPEPSSNLEYVGRLHYAFLDPEPGSGYMGTYFGEKKILTLGAGAAFEKAAVYKNVSYVGATDTTTLRNQETADYTAYAADLMFEYPFPFGLVTLDGQYLKIDFRNAYQTNANPADRNTIVAGLNGQKEGGYGKLAYMLPVTIGKEGKIQPYILYERWRFAHLLGVNLQTIDQKGVGINYYIKHQNVRTTLEYLETDFGHETTLFGITDPNTKIKDFRTVRLMFQIVI